jgi:hypothetical protein
MANPGQGRNNLHRLSPFAVSANEKRKQDSSCWMLRMESAESFATREMLPIE